MIDFGGGRGLHDRSGVAGGLAASGNTSCADHNIAWRIREKPRSRLERGGAAASPAVCVAELAARFTVGRFSLYGCGACFAAEDALMKTLVGFVSAAALASILAAPLALAADTKADAFMQKAIEGNLAEIKVGQLAQQKGASEGVRHFGAVLEQDHSTANSQAMTAASSMGVTPPAEPSAKEQAVYQRLASLSGSKFDKAFVKVMVKDHRKDIAEFKKEAKAGNSPAASYAAASLPTLQKHLRMAESLERHPSG